MRSAIIAAVAVAALAGCSSYDSVTQRIAQSITPYRITIVQGNFVSQEKASQLKAGMTRAQVRALLGTPLLTDMFHADRWDYIFYFKRGSTSIVQQRDLVLLFQGDLLSSWTGAENLPSNLDLLADIDGDRISKKREKALAAAAAAAQASGAQAASAATATPAANPAPAAAASPAPAGVSLPPDLSSAETDTSANAEAARAANRATNQVSSQGGSGGGLAPSLQNAPSAPTPGMPTGGTPSAQQQFQFHRPAQPTVQNDSPPPVGPQGTDTLPNQPLTAPAAPASGAQGTGG